MEIIEGKCELMCPERERKWREKNGLLHRFEVFPHTERESSKKKKADPDRAVKQYSRPAAGRNLLNPNELRPLHVLEKTVQYLIRSIMAKKEEKWIDIYEFCSDRLRSVCQDLTIQRLNSSWILECAVRFYLYSDYRLFDIALVQRYDAAINTTLLMDCLKQVLSSYLHNCESADKHKRQSMSLMTAIYVLFNLDSQEALLYALSLDKTIRCHPLLSSAIQISIAYHSKNFLSVLRSMQTVPPLLGCCLHKHLQHLRKQLLLRLCHGFSSKTFRFPLERLSNWLQISDTEQVSQLCAFYGLTVHSEGVLFLKTSFLFQKQDFPRCHDPDLDRKLGDADVLE